MTRHHLKPQPTPPKTKSSDWFSPLRPATERWIQVFQAKNYRIQNHLNQSLPIKIMAWPFVKEGTLLGLLIIILGLGYLLQDLPSPTRLTAQENFAVSTQILDRNGQLLYEIFGDENRTPIKVADLPDYVKQATIAIEDKNFYHHFGFDLGGIFRASLANLSGKRIEGGSTITQQLVKNALLTREKSFTRKAKEAILAVMTEALYSKDEILEMYLNYISYGGTSVGIEAAAKKYFDKSAKNLDLAEAALLVGLPQAPSTYSPFGSTPEKAKARQAEVLRRMVEDGYLTEIQAETAKAEVLHFALSRTDIQAPHFVFYVRDLLYQEFGEDMVERGGLRVTTTLDLNLQTAVQASLSAEVNKLARLKVGNGAALVTKPNTGEILAMIGSNDYFDTAHDGQVNVTLALRQPGSSIKPLMYATAFERKVLNPGTILLDIPTCFKNPGQRDYCPKNYSGDFKGPMTVRQSLGNSLNIPAVKGLYIIGLENFIDQATKLGITTWKDPSRYGLALTLGGGEVRMIDMAEAFGTIANQGVKVPLTPILSITDFRGQVIQQNLLQSRLATLANLTQDEEIDSQDDLERVMRRAPAYLVSHIMQDNTARVQAFGPNSQLVFKGQVVSAKTGTTNDLKDNWTVGFTPEFLTIAWVGNNNNTSMSYLASGITGAAPIFHDIMSLLLKNRPPLWPEKPDDVAMGVVCASGLPPQAGASGCGPTNSDWYWKESTPSASLIEKANVWIHSETGLPFISGETTDGLVLEEHMLYSDPVTKNYCADCTRAVNEQGKIIYEQYLIPPTGNFDITNLDQSLPNPFDGQ
ncbi:MAG TPA: penicillin-binding protein [Candidatus Pacebacteria bacterium]|nr:penicillin-binding protein [Candidatus Paceibacterota bacterium]